MSLFRKKNVIEKETEKSEKLMKRVRKFINK